MTPVRPKPWVRPLAGAVLLLLVAACASPPPPPPPPAPVATPPAPPPVAVVPPPPRLPQLPTTYVMLLPDADGQTGVVEVQGPKGTQRLTQAQYGVALDGGSPPFLVDTAKQSRDFTATVAARPPVPETAVLYFELGGTALTLESRLMMRRLIERAKVRPGVDLSVVGHTDTLGRPEANEGLALRRAQFVAESMRSAGMPDVPISIESHGERNLLVPTADETAEPRNRRVEIVMR